jgi:leucyl-tRNA synthetase
VEIVLQVNGKVREKIVIATDMNKDQIEKIALSNEKIIEFISGKDIVKVVVVPKKLVNIVIK